VIYDFELEPEVRDWLDSLNDSGFKRDDEVCGMLAQSGTRLGGPWSDYLEGRYGNCGSGFPIGATGAPFGPSRDMGRE
jgi:hypothetical protein